MVVHQKALMAYQPKPYTGPMTVFRAGKQPHGYQVDPKLGWGKWVSGTVEVMTLPGHHTIMLVAPHVQEAAIQLAACLSSAEA